MPPFGSISRRELIRSLRRLGFHGPGPGGRHEFMRRGDVTLTLPNPHRGAIGVGLLARILRQAGVSRSDVGERVTGSPFESVPYEGRLIHASQGNNVYVFPGVGLGAVVSGAREVTDAMFAIAADTLASSISESDLAAGRLYPPLSQLREISRDIALAVGREAINSGLAAGLDESTLHARLEDFVWQPSYPRVLLTDPH